LKVPHPPCGFASTIATASATASVPVVASYHPYYGGSVLGADGKIHYLPGDPAYFLEFAQQTGLMATFVAPPNPTGDTNYYDNPQLYQQQECHQKEYY
jgi:hypothetical protein